MSKLKIITGTNKEFVEKEFKEFTESEKHNLEDIRYDTSQLGNTLYYVIFICYN